MVSVPFVLFERPMKTPFFLNTLDTNDHFPDVSQALRDPNGLLAIGGDLSPERLLQAYRRGIFPWYSNDQPVMWWSPDPRMVLFPPELRVSRSLRRTVQKNRFRITTDKAFPQVIRACAQPRYNDGETWITQEMEQAYIDLHQLKWAHSVEAWSGEELAGGFYGIAIGQVFFGESMFYRQSDASKVALVSFVSQLQEWGFELIDCQVTTSHLLSLGAREIPRKNFIELLDKWCSTNVRKRVWDSD